MNVYVCARLYFLLHYTILITAVLFLILESVDCFNSVFLPSEIYRSLLAGLMCLKCVVGIVGIGFSGFHRDKADFIF